MKNIIYSTCIWFALILTSTVCVGQFATPNLLPDAVTTGFDDAPDFKCGDNEGAFRLLDSNADNVASMMSLWSETPINLEDCFELNFSVRFSDPIDTGADGICFVLQRGGVDEIGMSGGYLGYYGSDFTESIAVEIDIFRNTVLGDNTPHDHVALVYDEELDDPIVGPIVVGPGGDIEDGVWRDVTIRWTNATSTTQNIQVTFDGQLVINHTDEIVTDIFGGDSSNITWGFTAGKDNSTARHDICIGEMVPCVCYEETDLTACAEEGDFGFITYSCNFTEALSFSWELPVGSTAIVNTFPNTTILTNASEGTYVLTVIGPDGVPQVITYVIEADCCEESCAYTFTDCEVTFIVDGLTVEFVSTTIPGNIKIKAFDEFWTWSDTMCDDWASDPCGPGSSVTAPSAGVYYIDVDSGPKSCRFKIELEECEKGPIKPDGDKLNGEGTSSNTSKMKCYPIPADDQITVQFDEVETGTIYMYDMTGKKLKSLHVNDELDRVINTSDLMPGIYFLEFSKGNSKIMQKVIIE